MRGVSVGKLESPAFSERRIRGIDSLVVNRRCTTSERRGATSWQWTHRWTTLEKLSKLDAKRILNCLDEVIGEAMTLIR